MSYTNTKPGLKYLQINVIAHGTYNCINVYNMIVNYYLLMDRYTISLLQVNRELTIRQRLVFLLNSSRPYDEISHISSITVVAGRYFFLPTFNPSNNIFLL